MLKGNKKPVAFRPGGGMPDNVNARAVLLSGPPGIGKTTTARLVAQQHGGYEVLQYNASDARGQKIIQQMAQGIAQNTTLNFGGGLSKSQAISKKCVIIMDEVDGMGAGDRGGNAALIKMIKTTRNPIICICNDQSSPKIRNLAFSCYDLKFSRPTKTTIAQRCQQIAAQEGLSIEINALEDMAEACGADMRMLLNQLQMMARTPVYQQVGVKYMDVKDRIAKDQVLMMNHWDAAQKLFGSSTRRGLSVMDQLDLFFVDHSIMPLMIQENYLRSVVNTPIDAQLLNRCAYSADLMTIGDMLNDKIRRDQEWGLLPSVGITSTVYPAQVTHGFIGRPQFPQWLGKYSATSRTRRLTIELQSHLKLTGTTKGRNLLTSGFGDLLYKKLMKPLKSDGEANENVRKTAEILDAYGLRKEHLTEHLTDLRSHLGCEDEFKLVDAKVKSAFTRELNSGNHIAKVALPQSKKRKTGGGSGEGLNPDDPEAEEEAAAAAEAEPDEKADSDDELGGMVKVRKPKGKAKAKSKAKGDDDAEGSPSGKAKAKAKGRSKAKAKA